MKKHKPDTNKEHETDMERKKRILTQFILETNDPDQLDFLYNFMLAYVQLERK